MQLKYSATFNFAYFCFWKWWTEQIHKISENINTLCTKFQYMNIMTTFPPLSLLADRHFRSLQLLTTKLIPVWVLLYESIAEIFDVQARVLSKTMIKRTTLWICQRLILLHKYPLLSFLKYLKTITLLRKKILANNETLAKLAALIWK